MNNGIQETQLEWNEFEKLLHVATASASEARYILTPNFMSDLYDWWKLQKGNIRIAFMEEKMYILYPDSGIKLKSSVSAITTESLQNYIISNAIPLLHILHLIEDLPTKPEVN